MLHGVKALLRHAMSALFPRTEKWPGVKDTGVDEFLTKFLNEAPLMVRGGAYLGAIAFMMAPLITIGIPLPSFLLTASALDRHAIKVASHPFYLLRQAVFVVKVIAGLCWAAHPSIRKELNLPAYDPDPGTWRTE